MNRKNLRVTILALNFAPEPSGNAPYTTSLARGLSLAGHEVRVLTGYPHYPDWRVSDGYTGASMVEELAGIRVHRLRHYVPKNPNLVTRLWMELTFGARLLFADWNSPDVVVLVSPALFSTAIGLVRARLQRRRPATCVWVQDLYGRGVVETGSRAASMGGIVSAAESAILRSADGVVAIHDRFRSYMENSLGLHPEKVDVIRNWTHLSPTVPEGRKNTRSLLGWSPDDVIVLHAGNMGQKQGLENVIDAAKVSEQRGSSVRFVLMGGGNQRDRLEAIAEGVSTITFMESLPDAEFLSALAAADVLLVNELPGVKEMAVPSKLTSYFNAGVPVVAATDEGSVTAYELEKSGGGVRVPAGDPFALVEAAETLAKEPEVRERLGRNGLQFRHETLSEEAAMGHYDDVIIRLATSRGH